MYDLHRSIMVAGGSASLLPKNLTIFKNDVNNLVYAAVADRYQANTVSWDSKVEGMANDTILSRHPQNSIPLMVVQVKYCTLSSRPLPLLVICTVGGVMIHEWNGTPLLAWIGIGDKTTDIHCYTKGIATMSNYICVGCHTGEILVFSVRDTSVKQKSSIDKHKNGISDLASDCVDAMVSVDSEGVIITFDGGLKVNTKISTCQPITCVAVVDSMVMAGTALGQMLIYNGNNGALMVDISAHARAISAIDVTAKNRMILTASEDSFIRMWSLTNTSGNNLKGDSGDVQVECIYSHSVEDCCLTGAEFVDRKESEFVVTAFDYPIAFYFKQQKKPKSKK